MNKIKIGSILKKFCLYGTALVVCMLSYFSFFGPKNLAVVDAIVKNLIEINIANLEIEDIKTGVLLDWKDRSLLLSIEECRLNYNKKTSLTLPDFKLKLNLLSLVLNKPGQILKGVVLNEQKMEIVYHKENQGKHATQEKIPITNVLTFVEKYKEELKNSAYRTDDFVIGIHNNGGTELDVVLQNFEINFGDFSTNLNANIKTTIKIGNVSTQAEFLIKDNSKNALNVDGILTNTPLTSNGKGFEILGTTLQTNFQLSISTKIDFLNAFDKISFQFLQKGGGYIHNDTYLNNGLKINHLELKGEVLDNAKELRISEIDARIEDNIIISGNAKYAQKNFSSAFYIENLSAAQLFKKWQKKLYSEAYQWLVQHILSGEVSKLEIAKQHNEAGTSSIGTKISFKNVDMKYLSTAPNLYLKEGEVRILSNTLSVHSTDAAMSNSQINQINATIEDLTEEQIAMRFSANIYGDITDQINIANSHYAIGLLPNIKGKANSKIDFIVPFYKTPTFEDIELNLQSQLSQVAISDIFYGYDINQGVFKTKLLGQNLYVEGQGNINGYLNTKINGEFSIKDRNSFNINLSSKTSLENFQKAGVPFSQFFGDKIKVKGVINGHNNVVESEFTADLHNTSVNLQSIGIEKKVKMPGKIQVKLYNEGLGETKILKCTCSIPGQNFSGIGQINHKLNELTHFKGTLSQKNSKGLTFQYDKNVSLRKFVLDGVEIDLSSINIVDIPTFFNLSKEKEKEKSPLSFSAKVDRVKLKNDILLTNSIIQANNLKNKKFEMVTSLAEDKKIRIYYNYPVLSITSPDAGAVFKGLGITDKINSGTLEIKGQFKSPSHFQGSLELSKFYALKTPFLVNLLTLSAPLTSLQSMMKNKGIEFYSFRCPIEYINDRLEFTDCIAESIILALKIRGNVDLQTGYLDAKGVMVPENIVNTLFKKIPLLNVLSGHKNEGLILSTLFDVKGYINKDIKIYANYLSTFTPGFLREIFKKPINTRNAN
ncbi:hypothetical protein [Candidatus Bandiella euplotis]|uniref:DUF3971 domain-containing protein n=1 Tax=Candidatus Bandiella euplotis TaxID=1664265 RepID=A0ABZ0ULF4_9RICK|nr:hypothetical protein [Candidatus Bandiella woodruffii]WPX96966.1 hypothetical protein Bandiella_01105 [Candidatus Bandiella woodruffii]